MSKRIQSFPRILALAGLFISILVLPACTSVDPGLVQGSVALHFRQSREEQKAALESIGRSSSWVNTALFNTAFGEAIFYLPDSFRSDFTQNEDVFINYVVGAYLARYPDITYDSIDTYFPGVGVLEKSGITPERFDYARRFGQIWLKSIEDDPKNKAMKDRLALFQKRFGRQDIIPLQNIRTLLRDDQAFKAFLTDDAAAIAWVNKNQDINKTQREHTFSYQSIDSMLHPITVGVLPALAS